MTANALKYQGRRRLRPSENWNAKTIQANGMTAIPRWRTQLQKYRPSTVWQPSSAASLSVHTPAAIIRTIRVSAPYWLRRRQSTAANTAAMADVTNSGNANRWNCQPDIEQRPS